MKKLRDRLAILSMLILCLVVVGSVSAAQCDCEELENCALPITRLSGQGFSVSGVDGGLSVTDPRTFWPPEDVMDPRAVFQNRGTQNTDVAILVVDDFGTSGLSEIPTDVFASADNTELEDHYRNGRLSHGALVVNHINALLEGAGLQPASQPASGPVFEWTGNGSRVGVMIVDALDYSTPAETLIVAGAIAQAIQDLQQASYDHFILNMSFAILPCSIARGYVAQAEDQFLSTAEELSFEEYAERVGISTGFTLEQFITPAESLVSPDPLHVLLAHCAGDAREKFDPQQFSQHADLEPIEPPDGVRSTRDRFEFEGTCQPGIQVVEYVGSAGNASLPYPFYPAAWDPVTSVSADDPNGHLSFYSNYNADRSVPGGWFFISDGTSNTIFYRGTSFSGPVQAVCQALGYC